MYVNKRYTFSSLCMSSLVCLGLIGCNDAPSSATPAAAEISAHHISATDSHVSIMGRTHTQDNKITFAYPGVSFFLNAQGSRLTATLKSTAGNSWMDVLVDDLPPRLLLIPEDTTEIVLFDNLDDKPHRVRLTHRGENWHGQITLEGFQLTGQGFLEAPKLPEKKLLVLGDSVTCGEAIDRVEGEQKTPQSWNARESYGLLTAEKLNAQVHLVCWGGRGLVRSWNGVTTDANLPEFNRFTVGDRDNHVLWDVTQYQPDFIVSAIGTNDFSQGIPDEQLYVNTYVTFLQQLLQDYPSAHILLIEGSILNGEKKSALVKYLARVVETLGSSRVHQASSNHYPGSPSDAHPTKEQHAQMADDLAAVLKHFNH